MWFWKRRRQKPEVRWTQDLRFLSEQDGPIERDLKAALAEELAAFPGVERAYLARVDYGNADAYEVALCIRGPEDRAVVERASRRFAPFFGPDVHMDIVFLTEGRERELAAVCRPFYAPRGT